MSTPAPESAVLPPPARLAETVEEMMTHKALNDPWRIFCLALMGGGWIAAGFIFFVTSQVGAGALPWGLVRTVGGLVFATGLFLVVTTGSELFTSTTMTLVAKAAGRITWGQLVKHWAIVYVGNLLGSMSIAVLCFLAGLPHNAKNGWGQVVLDAVAGKLHHTWVEAFFLGVLCNLCVCAAIWIGSGGRTLMDKFIAVLGPVALFVATGMEHSVANMFLIPLGLIIKDFGGEPFQSLPGYELLTWGDFFLRNLIPVTLGNIVGGGVMIGLMNWAIQRWHATKH